jgi:hypothetical protein
VCVGGACAVRHTLAAGMLVPAHVECEYAYLKQKERFPATCGWRVGDQYCLENPLGQGVLLHIHKPVIKNSGGLVRTLESSHLCPHVTHERLRFDRLLVATWDTNEKDYARTILLKDEVSVCFQHIQEEAEGVWDCEVPAKEEEERNNEMNEHDDK